MIKLRSPIRCRGSKNRVACRISRLMTNHDTYVEAFSGGLSVLLNKKPANRELAIDTNADIMDFYRVLTKNTSAFMDELSKIQYRKEDFLFYKNMRPNGSLQRSVRFFVLNQMSYRGLGNNFSWSNRERGGQPASVNCWKTLVNDLPLIALRLKDVRFIQDSALDVIPRVDSSKTLIYCDPPDMRDYLEFTPNEHKSLLKTLLGCRSTVLISGRSVPLYESMLAGKTSMHFKTSSRNGSQWAETVWVMLGG